MSKMAEVLGRARHPNAKKVKGINFKYADLGNCYSYVSFSYEISKKTYYEDMELEEFFEFIGEQLLNKNK